MTVNLLSSQRACRCSCCFMFLFTSIHLHLSTFPLPYSLIPHALHLTCLPPHLLFQSSHSLDPSPLLASSSWHCLFYFSLKEYIEDVDKCNGPLAWSPLQLGLGRHFSYCIKSTGPFSLLPFFSSCIRRMLIHRGATTSGLWKLEWRLRTCRFNTDDRLSASVSNM